MRVSSVRAWLVLNVFAVIGVSAISPPKSSQRGIFRFAERNLATPQVKPFPKVLHKNTGGLKSAHPTPDDHCEPRTVILRLHDQVHQTPDSKITKSAHSTSSKGIHGVKKEGIPQYVAPKASATTIHDKEKKVLSVKHLQSKGGSEFPGENRKRSTYDTGDKAGPKIKSVPSSHSASLHEKKPPHAITKIDDNLKKTDLETNEVLCKIRSGTGVEFHGSFEQLHQPRVIEKPYFAHGTCTSSTGSQNVKKGTHDAASSSSKVIHGVKKGEHIATSIPSAKGDPKVPRVEKRTHSLHDTKGKTGSEVKSLKANVHGIAEETKLTYRLKKTGQSARNGGVKSTPEEGKQPHPAQQATGQAKSKVTGSLKKTALLAHTPAVKLQPKGMSRKIHDSRHGVPQLAEAVSKAIDSLKKTGQLALDTEAKSNPKQTGSVEKQQHPEYHDTLNMAASKSTESLKINAQAPRGPAVKSHHKSLPKPTNGLNHDGAAKIASKVPDSLKKATPLAHDTGSKSNPKLNPSVQKQQHPEYHETMNNAGSKPSDQLENNAQASLGPAGKTHSKNLPKQTQDSKHDGATRLPSKLIDSLKKVAQLAHDTGAESYPRFTASVKKQQHAERHDTSSKAGSKATNDLKKTVSAHAPAAKSHPEERFKRNQDLKHEAAVKIASKSTDSLKKASQLAHDSGAKSNPKLIPTVKKQQHPEYQDTIINAGSKPNDSLKKPAQASHGPATKPHSDLLKRTQDSKHDGATKISSKIIDGLKKVAQLAHHTGAKSDLRFTSGVKKQQHSEHHDTSSKAGEKTVPVNGPAATTVPKERFKRNQDIEHDSAAKMAFEAIDRLKKVAESAHNTGTKPNPKVNSSVKKQQHSEKHGTMNKAESDATRGLKKTVASHGSQAKSHPEDRSKVNKDYLQYDRASKIASKVTDNLKKTHLPHNTGTKLNPQLTSSAKKQQHSVHRDTSSTVGSKLTGSQKKTASSAKGAASMTDPNSKVHKGKGRRHDTSSKDGSKATKDLKKTVSAHAPAAKSRPEERFKRNQDLKHEPAVKIASKLADNLKKASQLAHDTGAKSNPKLIPTVNKQQHPEYQDTIINAGSKPNDSLKKPAQASHGPANKPHSNDLPKQTRDSKHDGAMKISSKIIDSLKKVAQLAHHTGAKSDLRSGVKKQQHSEHHDTSSKAGKKTVPVNGPAATPGPKERSKRNQDLEHDSAAKMAFEAIDRLKKVAESAHNTGTKPNPKVNSSVKKQQHSEKHGTMNKAESDATGGLKKTVASHGSQAKSHPEDLSKVNKDLQYDTASKIASKVTDNLKKTHLPHNTGTKLNPQLTSSAKKQQHSVQRDTSSTVGSKLTGSQKKTASSANGAASMTDPNSKVHKGKGRHTGDVIIGNRMGNWLNSLLW